MKRFGILGGLLLIAALLYVFSPTDVQWMPRCLFKTLTGWQCPGCGLLRAGHALLHGHFAEALAYNYFLIISLPYLALCMASAWWPQQKVKQRMAHIAYSPAALWTFSLLTLAWWLLRNLLNI